LEKLKAYLEADEADKSSSNDFGKDVIPKMLAAGEKLYAHLFDGYWKDVGTVDSLWEANLDLLSPKIDFNLSDRSWRIYSKNPASPPHFVEDGAILQNSLVAEGCYIAGSVDFSVLFANVTIEKGAVVRDSIIMPGSVVKSGAVVQYAILAENVTVEQGASIGLRPEDAEDLSAWGVSVVGQNITVGKNVAIPPKAMLDGDVFGEEGV
jgi:glucose-1-phosphate adenylyltransferase